MPFSIGSERGFFSMPRVAIDGVKRLIEIPCAQPALIWVETFNMAALAVFSDILFPDPREIYTKVRGNSTFCDLKRISRGIAQEAGLAEGPLIRSLYTLGERLDFATFTYWLADEFATGIYNWSTNMKTMAKCTESTSPFFADGHPIISAIPADGSWQAINVAVQPTSHWAPSTATVFGSRPGGKWSVSAGVTFCTFDGIVVPTACRVRNLTTGRDYGMGDFYPDGKGRQAKAQIHVDQVNNDNAANIIQIEFSTIVDRPGIVEVYPHLKPGNVFWFSSRPV